MTEPMKNPETTGKIGKPRSVLRRLRLPIVLVLLAAAAAAVYLFAWGGEAAPVYRTAKVERGTLVSSVSASGTLKAVITVDVGSQVSGQIKELLADFNTEVKEGQIIARLDPETFKARVLQAEAELAVAKGTVSGHKAALVALEADIKAADAVLAEAKRELARKRDLFARRVASAADVDKARANHDQAAAKRDAARAKLIQQKAQVEIAQAQVRQKEAALYQARLNLEHTIIRSPVNGVVIARNVSMGQTVAASLQAPVLFTIAQDLRNMQVEVNVDEADIGRIREGQSADFTVDAFPGRKFPGRVKQIRKQPKEESNVVTYTVVVTAANPDQRLLPGMTANVTFIVTRREGVLKVPNSALRFRPGAGVQASRAAPTGAPPGRGGRGAQALARLTERLKLTEAQQAEVRAIFAEMRRKLSAMRRGGASREDMRAEIQKLRARNRDKIAAVLTADQRQAYRRLLAARTVSPIRRGQLWVLGNDGVLRGVRVTIGITDGGFSEIVRGRIEAGDQVVIGVSQAAGRRRRAPRLGI